MATKWFATRGSVMGQGSTIAEAVMSAIGTHYLPAGYIIWADGSLAGEVCGCVVGPADPAIFGADDRKTLQLALGAAYEAWGPGDPYLGTYYYSGTALAERLAEIEAACEWQMSLRVGERVEGGETPEDYDTGRVAAIDGDQVAVAWDSGVETTQHVSLVRPQGRRVFA